MATHIPTAWFPQSTLARLRAMWRASAATGRDIALFGPWSAAALLAGVTAGLLLPALPATGWLATLFLAGVALPMRGDAWRLLGVLLFGLGFAGLHADHVLRAQLPIALERRAIQVEGRIAELPMHEPRRTRFEFVVDDEPSQPRGLRGKRIRLGWFEEDMAGRARLQAGSRWAFPVELRAPTGLRNPGASDGEKHALASRIAASGHVMEPALARRLAPPKGIGAWRERMSARIAASVPSDSSRYARALALGDTRALDETDWSRLRAAGLTHLIAISGFHVGLVAGFFAMLMAVVWWLLPGLCRWLPRPFAAGLGAIAGACLYAALTGFAVPTLRTAVMIAALVAARCLRRRQRLADTLSLGCIVLLLLDPLAVLGAGFWLSFAGVAWLLWCLPADQGPRRWAMLHGFVAAQAVATLGLLPLTVLLFGQASFAGPIANLAAVPWWSLVVVPLALIGVLAETLHQGLG